MGRPDVLVQPDVFVVRIAGTSSSNYAQLTCTSDVGNVVSVAFGLPSVFNRQSGGASVPISFGTQSARISPFEGSSLRFDPATGVNSYPVTTETFTVSLGEFTSEESQKVNVNLTGRPSGIYSSSTIVTIASQ